MKKAWIKTYFEELQTNKLVHNYDRRLSICSKINQESHKINLKLIEFKDASLFSKLKQYVL
jgi:hypothetical protein